MKRRQFITLLGGAAAWPFACACATAGADAGGSGVFYGGVESDPVAQMRIATFRQVLAELGWSEGRNVRLDYRWGSAADPDRLRNSAAELIALAPDVVATNQGTIVRALQQASRSVPIVFAGAGDPVGGGTIESLARPGGNTTGFSGTEYVISGKLLSCSPDRAGRDASGGRDPTSPGGSGNLGQSRPQRPRSGWSCDRSMCAMPARIERGDGGAFLRSGRMAAWSSRRAHRRTFIAT